MNIKDLTAALPYLYKAQITPFLHGHRGTGKTTTVKNIAKDWGFLYFGLYLGTQSDTGDVLGLYDFVKDENGTTISSKHAMPSYMQEIIKYCRDNPESGAILHLDEFNRANKDILQGMFPLALDKQFHTLTLPKNCFIIASGNPDTEDYDVTSINDTALMTRFAHIKMEPTLDEWVTYAKQKGYNPNRIDFIKEQPGLLSDAIGEFEIPVKVDWRSWDMIDRLEKIETPPYLLAQLEKGILGLERIVAYEKYLQSSDKPLKGEEVLDGTHFPKLEKWSNSENVKASLLNLTIENLTEFLVARNLALSESEKDLVLKFLEVLPKEFAYVFVHKNLFNSSLWMSNFLSDRNYESKVANIIRGSREWSDKKETESDSA